MGYILSIDQSTAGTKGLVFNKQGRLLSRCDIPHRQITNDQGWVEHDPMEIYRNVLAVAKKVIDKAGILPDEIEVIGISNQRETAICWDKATGEPVYNAIVWQCGRAAAITEAMEARGLADEIKQRTGLNLSPFFSAAKFSWILRNVPEAGAALRRGNLCCGTVDAWLIYKLTGELKTDYSNASRTQLLNLDTLDWDPWVVEAFGLKGVRLPEVCFSDSLMGMTTFDGLFPREIAIHGALGDSHAALFANHCTEPYMAKVTYGTGSSVMMNAGAARPKSGDGIVTSLAWGMNGQVLYALEGNINYTGAVIKWLIEDVHLIENGREAAELAESVTSTEGVYLVPAFSGLGAPYFSNDARAILCGMSRSTRKEHIVRAAEECIAYQVADVIQAMNAVGDKPLSGIRADGGPTKARFLMQFQSDILNIPLAVSSLEELSGAGAAYCAALGAGVSDEETLFSGISYETIQPEMQPGVREALVDGWHKAIQMII